MNGPIFGICSVLTLLSTAVVLIRAITQRRRASDPFRTSRRAHLVALVSSYLVSTLAVPPVAASIDQATTAELSVLITDIAGLIFCASLQTMIINWEYRELPHDVSIICRVGFVVVISGLLIWQFRRANPSRLGVDLSTSYVEFKHVRIYMLTYLGFFAAAGTEVAVRATRLACGVWRQGRAAGAGLAVAAAGATFGVLYALSQGAYILAYESGYAWPRLLDNVISPVLAGLGLTGIATGLSMAVLSNSRRPVGLRRSINA
ncbi:hypothetical protein [Streptomyces sp. BH105]|uniref:hypothetical protein n=1 Tax=Streptomyces sp. BH105 TaxID=3410408 RepID=UPI003CF4315A